MYRLPDSLSVNGTDHKIRTDYRDVMNIMAAMEDPNLEDSEKVYVTLFVLYEDFEDLSPDDYEEAFNQALWFLNNGETSQDTKRSAKLIDFEQDERLLIPAINRVAGFEVRSVEYMHWWTFLGYYMEIGECTYSSVINIRSKRASGKKLEKWENEFFLKNKDIVLIKEKLSDEEIEDKKRLMEILG